MNPPAERCRASWRLSGELSEQCRIARERGINEDNYPPFQKVLTQLQIHFKTCADCRAWVDDWEKHGCKQSTHNPLR